MSEQIQTFLCCTRKQVMILRCAGCNKLLGYCRACYTVFYDLKNLMQSLVLGADTDIVCASCQFTIMLPNLSKYLALERDLVDAGVSYLTRERVTLKMDIPEETPSVRCPKCGSMVPFQAAKCPRCGLGTPSENRTTGKNRAITTTGSARVNTGSGRLSDSSSSGRLSDPSGRLRQLQQPQSLLSNYLPKFISNLPWNKIHVPLKIAVPLVILVPIAALVFYFFSTGAICIGCIQIGGNYTTELQLENKKVRVDMLLYQYQGRLTGQVLFTPQMPTPTTPEKKQPPEQYVQLIQTGMVRDKNVSFQSYMDGSITRVQFNGQVAEGNAIEGELKLTMPEIGCEGKAFPITVKKL
ncbi:MAG: hypothetical protein AB1489_24435 [Acidobacteriota bacterium]